MLEEEIQQLPDAQGAQELPEKEALVGFFELLITVDQRLNPQLYD
jgi:hypothetical protein